MMVPLILLTGYILIICGISLVLTQKNLLTLWVDILKKNMDVSLIGFGNQVFIVI